MILHARRIFPIPDVLEMLHVGFSVNCMFSDGLRAEYAVLPPSINVKTISEEASANALWSFEQILDRIKEIKIILPAPPEVSKKYNPPSWLAIACMIVSNIIFSS